MEMAIDTDWQKSIHAKPLAYPAPKSINPEFIGRAIKLEAEHDGAIKEHLCQIVKQSRTINSAKTKLEREFAWRCFLQSRAALAALGVELR